MSTYRHKGMAALDEQKDANRNKEDVLDWSFDHNEKIHKQYTSHRDVNTIDEQFIERVIRESTGIKYESMCI